MGNENQWNDPLTNYFQQLDQRKAGLPNMPLSLDNWSSPGRLAMSGALSGPISRMYFPDPHRREPGQVLQAMAIDSGMGALGAAGGAALSRSALDPLISNWHPVARAGIHTMGGAAGLMAALGASRYMQDGVGSLAELASRTNQYYKDEARRQLFEEEERKKKTAAWGEVPKLVHKYAESVQTTSSKFAAKLDELDVDFGAWYAPESDEIWLGFDKAASADQLNSWARNNQGKTKIAVHFGPPTDDQIWVKLAERDAPITGITTGDLMDGAHSALVKPQYLFNGPNPMTATILGGLAMGGLGYGAGHLARWALPKSLKKYVNTDALPSMGLFGGAVAGALPGALWGVTSPKGWTSRHPFPEVSEDERRAVLGSIPQVGHAAGADGAPDGDSESLLRKHAAVNELFGQTIDVHQLSRSIMADAFRPLPGQQDRTQPQNAAAAAGVLQAASARKNDGGFVSPWDVATSVVSMLPRAASGLAGGAIAGAALGRTLGFLGALTPEGEQKAREAGIWAGLINTMVPKAFDF